MVVITSPSAREKKAKVAGSPNGLDLDLFHTILNTQAYTHQTLAMRTLITHIARGFGATVWSQDGNVYAVKGNAERYPTVVAHTDTVHKMVPDDEYVVHNSGDIYFAFNPRRRAFTGIGGDDKVGIYIALVALKYLPNVKAAFFRDEEIGCVGSRLADMNFFNDSSLVLQCDRRGKGDFVDEIMGYELYGDEFKRAIAPYLTQYGFREMGGAITDVGELKENGLTVACANMSCGYHSPHSDSEYILASEVLNTQNLVFDLLALGVRKTFHHQATRRQFGHRHHYSAYEGHYSREWAGSTKLAGATTSTPTSEQHADGRYLAHAEAVRGQMKEASKAAQAALPLPPAPAKPATTRVPILDLKHAWCPTCDAYSLFAFGEIDKMWFCKECLVPVAEYENLGG